MKRLALAVLVLTACTDEQNVGATYSLRSSRWSIGLTGADMNATRVAFDPDGDVIAAGTRGFTAWVTKRSGGDGSELWTRELGGGSESFSLEALAVDRDGNAWLAGRTTGTVPFGDQTISTPDTRFVGQITPEGHTAWVHTYDPDAAEPARGLAVAADGSYYLSTGPGSLSAFEPDGTRRWTQTFPAVGSIALAGDGTVALVATLDRSATFGSTPVDLQHQAPVVVARIDAAGTATSVRTYGTAGTTYIDTLFALDASDRLVATTHLGLPLAAGTDDFMVSAAGDEVWRTSPLHGSVFAEAIATNGHGVLTAGRVTDGGLDLGGGALAGAMYLAARDIHGDLVDARAFGDPNTASTFWGVAMADSGAVAYVATIAAPVDFGNGSLPGPAAVIGVFGH